MAYSVRQAPLELLVIFSLKFIQWKSAFFSQTYNSAGPRSAIGRAPDS